MNDGVEMALAELVSHLFRRWKYIIRPASETMPDIVISNEG